MIFFSFAEGKRSSVGGQQKVIGYKVLNGMVCRLGLLGRFLFDTWTFSYPSDIRAWAAFGGDLVLCIVANLGT